MSAAQDDLAIADLSPAELVRRISVVEKEAKDKVATLESQIVALQQQLAAARVLPSTPVRDLPCFDPFRREDGRIITSSIYNKSTDSWWERDLLYPHEAIRRDMIEVEYVLVHHVKGDEPWKLVNFFAWYNNRFVGLVIAHHDGEEKIMFPTVRKRCNIPEKTSADHKVLMKLLNDVTEIGKRFFKLGGDASNVSISAQILPELRAKWTEAKVHMFPHLAEEEEQMTSLIKDKFTQEEIAAMVQSIVKNEGLGGAKRFLPSIVESLDMWGTHENRLELQRNIPPPIKFMLNRYWIKAYAKYHRGVLNSLRAGAPKVIIIERKGWFS